MKKWVLAGATLAVAGFVFAQSGSNVLNSFSKALHGAQGLSVTYTVTRLGGSPASYTVNLSKPNRARIESASQIITADGSTITFFDRKSNSYFKRKQTDAEFRALLTSDDLSLWAPFFRDDAFKGLNVKAMPDKNRKGVNFKVVTLTPPDATDVSWTLYIHPDDNVARQAEIVVKAGKDEGTKIIDCKSLTLETGDVFAFNAPAGSKEVDEAELYSDRWYLDWDEAMGVAKKTNRVLLVDFYTDWCHWCKVLDEKVFPTSDFRAMSKYFVFVKINAEVRTDLAKKYGVNAYPTAKVIGVDGSVIHEIVGYKETAAYVADLKTAAQKAGLLGN